MKIIYYLFSFFYNRFVDYEVLLFLCQQILLLNKTEKEKKSLRLNLMIFTYR